MVFLSHRPALHNQDGLVELRTRAGVHLLMPGVTRWAQVNGRDELNFQEKVHHEIFYLKNRSIALDFTILIMTIKQLFTGGGASH